MRLISLWLFVCLFLLVCNNYLFSSDNYTISGYVVDSSTNEKLIGTTIYIEEIPHKGLISNKYGFYSLTLLKGKHTIIANYIGYEKYTRILDISSDTVFNILLHKKNIVTEQIDIIAEKDNEKILDTKIGFSMMDITTIEKTPVILGERDFMKTLQLMPGIKSSSEGSSGFYVRGGGTDQNLILLDEAIVYNPTHLFGFFSVFNQEAIKDVSIYKGSIPSEYGGRLSSVVDIKMKDGNNKKYQFNGSIGLISARLNIEGPIVKEKSSFIVSARRTYGDIFLKMFDEDFSDKEMYFYDFNAKLNYEINDRNQVFLSGYFGRDRLKLSNQNDLNWGNATITLRWNSIINDKLFSNTSIVFSEYDYVTIDSDGGHPNKITSSIKDWNIKEDFQYFFDSENILKAGFNSVYHTINPGMLTSEEGVQSSNLLFDRFYLENAIYFAHTYTFFNNFTIDYGLRININNLYGPGDYLKFDSLGKIADTVNYNNGDLIRQDLLIEPRISLNYILTPSNSIKFSYRKTTQHLHLISSYSVSEPSDFWITNTLFIEPEVGNQLSLGYFLNFIEHEYEFSSELYYMYLQNQLDFKDGAQLEFNSSIETELLVGKGRSYGIEFMIKKRYGKFTGWLSYTLARTERQFDAINNGNYFPAKQDRTHDISLVLNYEFNKYWIFAANWVYYTGNAATFPNGKYEINGRIINYYSERNGDRMPDYHRLDISATWIINKSENAESNLAFSIYNVYAKQNPFLIRFQKSVSDPSKTEAIQTSLFVLIPSISYNFKF